MIRDRLAPLAGELQPARSRAVGLLVGAAIAGIAGELVLCTAGAHGAARAMQVLAIVAATAGLFARVRWQPGSSRIWLLFGIAVALQIASSAYAAAAFPGGVRQVPSAADALTLGAYPFGYAGLMLLLRSRAHRVPASLWLDGLIGGLCVAAAGAAQVFEPLLELSSGSTAEVVTNLAYPLADCVMLALVIASFALCGWRPGREWTLIGAAFITLSIADSTFMRQTLGDPSTQPSLFVSVLWTAATTLLMLAAWQKPVAPKLRVAGWPVLVLPATFTLMSIGLLVYGNLHKIGGLALVFAAAAVVAGMGRTLLTLREVRALAESRRQARTDDLTDLPNRRAFLAELERLTGAAGDGELALVLMDLDGFKELNDTLGHQAGDEVLVHLGQRLAGAIRDKDFLARLGGDEFAVLMPGLPDVTSARAAGERVLAAVREDFALNEMSVRVDASVGITLWGHHASTTAELLRRADIAMYQAKAEHGGVRLYESSRDRHSRDRLELSGQLRDAIANRELLLHFQPKVALPVGHAVGVEALVRWEHPQRGLIPPGEFIPLAERTGLMGLLTTAVLDQALAAMAAWQDVHPHLTMAVNISAANLLDVNFPDAVRDLLAGFGVDPSRVVLELTENSVMTDPQRGSAVLEQLHALGVQLALDDFGTGYSSLSLLALLPVDELKIDRSFITDLVNDRGHQVIVRAVVDLARHLGLRVVAEGIEDEATWAALCGQGCDQAQGFLMARPMPRDELLRWLVRNASDIRAWLPGRAVLRRTA